MSTLDPYIYSRLRVQHQSPEFVWKEGHGEAWKAALRHRLKNAIGLPDIRVPLDVQIEDSRSMEGYVRETISFSSRENLRVFAYLLIPNGIESPRPAVICVPGHGEGVDALVGEAPSDYHNQFALQCVQAGFVTLAIEQISFGHRKAAVDSDRGSSCVRDSMAALMLGESMIGWRCWDAMVALDFLRLRREVDPERIAIMGISGGGLTAFWTGCLDERFAATVVSGYFNTFFDSILSIDHCVDNFAFGLANIVEMPDMAALIAPRKLFVESGTEDTYFPSSAFERASLIAGFIYADQGVARHFGSDLFVGEHQFSGSLSLPQLMKWFGPMTG